MSDKSPRQSSSKKSTKSIKQKRADKKSSAGPSPIVVAKPKGK